MDNRLTLYHSHCVTCVKRNCREPPNDLTSCALISCENSCGAKYHGCKFNDHILLCPLERVPCINSVYGCPLVLLRSRMGSHLEICPASIVVCCVEWNRWPLHSHETKADMPRVDPHIHSDQLDVSLALRDQRMLVESLKIPKRIKKIFRNSLTRKYPAVPLNRSGSYELDTVSEETSRNVSDDEHDAPWELSKFPPGLQKSVCSRLFQATKDATDSLTTALDQVTSHIVNQIHPLTEILETSDGETLAVEPDHASDCDEIKCKEGDCCSVKNHKLSCTDNDSSKHQTRLNEILGLDLTIESISRYQPKPHRMYTFLCAQEFRRDEYPWHFKNVHNEIHCGVNGWLQERCPLAYEGCTYYYMRFFPDQPSHHVVHSSLLESFGITCKSTPDDALTNSNNNRDNYSLREATPEITTACKFDSVITIEPRFYSSRNTSPGPDSFDMLSRLPFQVLRIVARCLDNYSLSNLSLTCHYLRDVCCSMLDKRGMVLFIWEKQYTGPSSKVTWKVIGKVSDNHQALHMS